MSYDFDEVKLNSIAVITDKDFMIEEKENIESPIVRLGARGIIINDDGKIAVIFKKNKNEYKLPGGGIEKDEDSKTAFKRECEEELGVKVNIINELGTIEEYKSKENFKQLSFVYVGKKVADLGLNNLTEKEKEEGLEYLWLDKLDALDRMKKSLDNLNASKYDNVYRSKFMVLRDIKILEYFLNS